MSGKLYRKLADIILVKKREKGKLKGENAEEQRNE
jgi:hypothetical protein